MTTHYRYAFLFALLLHVVCIFMVSSTRIKPTLTSAVQQNNTVVHAIAVDPHRLAMQIKATENLQNRAKEQAQHTLTVLSRQVRQAKAARQAEQSRVNAMRRKQQVLVKKQQATVEKTQQIERKLRLLTEEKWQQKAEIDWHNQILKEQQQLNKQQHELSGQLQHNKIIDQYRARILALIQQNWHPVKKDREHSCQLMVYVAPGGVVTHVEILHASGDPAMDRLASAAVLKSSPLPVPKDSALFQAFRQLRIRLSPHAIKGLS